MSESETTVRAEGFSLRGLGVKKCTARAHTLFAERGSEVACARASFAFEDIFLAGDGGGGVRGVRRTLQARLALRPGADTAGTTAARRAREAVEVFIFTTGTAAEADAVIENIVLGAGGRQRVTGMFLWPLRKVCYPLVWRGSGGGCVRRGDAHQIFVQLCRGWQECGYYMMSEKVLWFVRRAWTATRPLLEGWNHPCKDESMKQSSLTDFSVRPRLNTYLFRI